MVLKDYQGKLLNGPNDVWLRPGGGLYFTDPHYKRPYWKRGPKEMDECVYYLAPDDKTLTRVIDDLKQPNGIIGTPDGKLLYVTDIGAGKTYRYRIQPDGALKEKKLFCELGSDGMTIDSARQHLSDRQRGAGLRSRGEEDRADRRAGELDGERVLRRQRPADAVHHRQQGPLRTAHERSSGVDSQ